MKKICFVTGARSEYGLLKRLMKKFQDSTEFELQIVVASMHFSLEFGETYKEIIKDGFIISKKVEMLLSADSETAVAKSMGLGVIEFTCSFEDLRPDILIILGDRFEILAACQAAMVLKIPIGHIHGGELTRGAIDEAIRHSITKMSHFHFTSTEVYKKRVIQLGESPDHVYNTGAPGIDNILRMKLMSRESLAEDLGMDLTKPFFLLTYHPATLDVEDSIHSIKNLFHALASFKEHSIIFTMPNSDPFGRKIMSYIQKFVDQHPKNMKTFKSLGQLRYLSALKEADAVIGNSSSGLIEAPALKTPTVNIGDRQGGRVVDTSIIQTSGDTGEVICAIKMALSPNFAAQIQAAGKIYGDGHASERIFKIIEQLNFKKVIKKTFFDIDFNL